MAKTSQTKTYGVVVWPKILNYWRPNVKSFFEAGCKWLIFPMFTFIHIEKQLEQITNKKVIYDGIDLSNARVVLAQQYMKNFTIT